MARNFKNLLNIEPYSENKRNILDIWVKWDSNYADYIEKTFTLQPKCLFKNKKLIYCLAYISCSYDFKGHGWNDNVFNHHITDNRDIDGLYEILSDYDFMAYSDWGLCHSLYGLEIIYYDGNRNSWDVSFDKIIHEFVGMTYNDICKTINSIE